MPQNRPPLPWGWAVPDTFSPADLAERWNCDSEAVLGLIRRGAIRAFTLSPPGSKRPRWRVARAVVEAFEAGQPTEAAPAAPSTRGKSKPTKRFFR